MFVENFLLQTSLLVKMRIDLPYDHEPKNS